MRVRSWSLRRLVEASPVVIALVGLPARGETPAGTRPSAGAALPSEVRTKVEAAIARSLKRLETTQLPEGAWKGFGGTPDPAVTSIVALGFAQDPHYGPKHPVVRRAMKYVLSCKQKDGGIYGDAGVKNYSASIALMFLSALRDPALKDEVAGQQAFLKGEQWREGKKDKAGQSIDPSHPWYGGAGYGHSERPDLSNTQMMLDALHESGLPASDPVYKRALVFIERCQMCSDTNDQAFAAKARDGGFIYSPANGGESKAGYETLGDDRILRSYGSMTYAGFKSMLYAGVDRDDKRVLLAWRWIRSHYTLDENPNMPGAHSRDGLYYYYHVFAKALRAWGEPTVTDADGKEHNWRADLCRKLLSEQRPDGSWVNTADRWMEGNPDLVSAYAILAMQEALR
ncbi:MAG TPA: terpene cyclase/mutase family protein [Phycisphaerae bacterium]|nr:terpene cyclase/mutase family protein [Phycisphaerae bacterium]